jgi:hypothetical protein
MSTLFANARLKIEWAKQYINDLHVLVKDSRERYSYSIIVEHDAKVGCDLFRLKAPEMMPVEFSPTLTNVLRNLRGALDSAWLNVAFDNPSVTEFPVYQTRNDLENAIEGTLKHQAAEDIIKFIVEVIQPYKGGDGEKVWSLHVLDAKAQQGRSLHLNYNFIQGIRAVDDRDGFDIPYWSFIPPCNVTRPCDGRRNVKITDYGEPVLGITFNDGLPMEGQYILAAMGELAVFIGGTINCLEMKFLTV